MKKIFVLAFATVLFATSAADARVSGVMSGEDYWFSTSLQYQFTSGDFERTDDARSDTDVDQQLRLVRLDLAPFERIQLYGTAGNATTSLGDTDAENGTVAGAGAEVLLSRNDDLRVKLTGSYLQHESTELDGSGEEIEVTDDWQGGILLSRRVREHQRPTENLSYDAYMSILYSDRTVEVTGSGTPRSLEMADAGGVSATAGFNLRYTKGINLELEGEVGAMTSASGRLIFTF